MVVATARCVRAIVGCATVLHVATSAMLIAAVLLLNHSPWSFGLAAKRVTDSMKGLVATERRALCPAVAFGIGSAAEAQVRPEIAVVEASLLPGLSDLKATASEVRRIADQAVKAQRLECMHVALLASYVANYYMAVLASMVFGAIASVCLLLIGPKGWTAANPYVINVLVTSAAIAAFYGLFPTVFQQPAMLAAHKAQALRYEALLDGMASFTTSQVTPAACAKLAPAAGAAHGREALSVPQFIACVDAALAALDLPFGLEPAKGFDLQAQIGKPGQ